MSTREQREMKENSVPSVATLLQWLRQKDLLPAIFFIFSRKGCDSAAKILCESLKTKAEEEAGDSRRPVLDKTKERKGKMMKGG